jgi:hypothetical protein
MTVRPLRNPLVIVYVLSLLILLVVALVFGDPEDIQRALSPHTIYDVPPKHRP